MSTLQIIKLQSGAFKHVDSIDGEFFLGRFSFKNEFAKAFLVEAYGAKRREYSISEITVFDYLGTAESFTNFTDLVNRLVVLKYTGIDTNQILNFLSNDISSYATETTITGTEHALIHDGVGWKKIIYNNIKAWFDTFYQSILVSGTNIKTINGSSVLGSGDLAVGGGEDFIQSQFQWYHFTTLGSRNGVFNAIGIASGTVSNAGAGGTSQLANYQNIQQFNSSTSANSGYRIGTVDFITGDGSSRFSKQIGLTYFTTFCIYANSSADTIIRLGYSSSSNAVAPTIGAFIEITGTSVVFKSVNGGVATTSASATLAYSTSVSTEIPYDVLIHFDSLTQVSCKIVRYDGVVMLNTAITTNIPGASALFHAMALGFIQTAGTVRPIFGLQKIGIGTKKPSFLNSF